VTVQTARRVLIVEDEFLIALHLEDLLTELGHQVIAVAARVPAAVEFARGAAVDLAVLDINLAGVQSFPVADILRERNIPFMFASGYGDDGLVDGYRHETVLRKPFGLPDVRQAIAAVISPGSA
jgi:CheY-like chemotaxis protein